MSRSFDVVLLDIEGTTTPINFVYGVLFPFAREHCADFLTGNAKDAEKDIELLWDEYQHDVKTGCPIAWTKGGNPLPYIHWLMDLDRKSTALKSLQGKIWEAGYLNGRLKGDLFPDVKPAIEKWIAEGKSVAIFSSGSVLAQKLLFKYSVEGDLSEYISGYFDTTTGNKREPTSYEKIAKNLEIDSSNILFISDIREELDAAQSAHMQVLLSVRPGNTESDWEGERTVDFSRISL